MLLKYNFRPDYQATCLSLYLQIIKDFISKMCLQIIKDFNSKKVNKYGIFIIISLYLKRFYV